MTINSSIKGIAFLAVAVFSLLAYNFISAANWTAPAAGTTPPANNIDRPINVGADYQRKVGDLGAVRVRAGEYCNAAGTVCFNPADIAASAGQVMDAGTASMPISGSTSHASVTFSQSFSVPPKVSVSVSYGYFNGPCRGDTVEFRVQIRNVTRTGFVVEAPYRSGGCGTNHVREVSWVAVSGAGVTATQRDFTGDQIKSFIVNSGVTPIADSVHSSANTRAHACEMMFPGSTPVSFVNGRVPFTKKINSVFTVQNGNWVRVGARGGNTTIERLTCRNS